MTTPPIADGHVFPLPVEVDLCAANLARIADVLAGDDPVTADNLRRACGRLRASLAAGGHPVTD